jgi:hypothetical protein
MTKQEERIKCAEVMSWLLVEMDALDVASLRKVGTSDELTVFRAAIQALENIVASLEEQAKNA